MVECLDMPDQTPAPLFPQTNNEKQFIDPGRKAWVWIGFAALFVGMLPVWPFKGNWFGLPAWAVFAIVMSFVVSAFSTFVILWVWQDPIEIRPRDLDP
ncbi:MAG: hypothetical protein VYC17_05135 [Nitrospinota bacterium]|nr:hypothetical protein [Nitrospinota bacterium]